MKDLSTFFIGVLVGAIIFAIMVDSMQYRVSRQGLIDIGMAKYEHGKFIVNDKLELNRDNAFGQIK